MWILHMDRIAKTSLMTFKQMKEFRADNPYLVIDCDKEFIYADIKK